MKTLPDMLFVALIGAASVGPSSLVLAEPVGISAAPAAGGMPGERLRHWLERMEDEGPGRNESYGDVVLRHIDELKLTDEQAGKIARLHQANQQKIMNIGQRMREAKKSAYALFLNPTVDEAAIRQSAKSFTAAFDEMVDTALKTRQAINAVLTPEQAGKLATLKVAP